MTMNKSSYQIFDSNRLKCSHPIGEPQTKDCGQYHQPRTKKGGVLTIVRKILFFSLHPMR
jgi:hypothetical protein